MGLLGERLSGSEIGRKGVDPVAGSFEKPYTAAAKITRGGGYEFDEDECLVFRRDGATPNVRMPDIGFRLVMVGDSKSASE